MICMKILYTFTLSWTMVNMLPNKVNVSMFEFVSWTAFAEFHHLFFSFVLRFLCVVWIWLWTFQGGQILKSNRTIWYWPKKKNCLAEMCFFHNMDIGCKGQREQNINVEIMSLMSCPGLCNKKIADVAYRLHNQRLAEKENTAKQISFSFPSLQELHLWWLLHFSYWH